MELMIEAPKQSVFTKKEALYIAAAYQVCLVSTVFTFLALTDVGLDPSRLAGLFSNWDARHYLHLATYGYTTSGDPANFIVFFPLFPFLVWLGSFITPPVVAGVLITNISSIIGHAYFILFLQKRRYSRAKIWRVLLLLMLSPVSIYFTLNYTEGLLLGLTGVFLYYLERKKFLGAAAIGCLASMTKLVGILFLIPYAFYCIRLRPVRINWRALTYAALIPCGYAFYSLINYLLFGNPLHYMIIQREHWSKQSANPFTQYWFVAQDMLRGYHFEASLMKQTYTFDYIALLLAPLIILIYVLLTTRRKRLPIGYILWSIAQLLVFTSQSYWLSSFRYAALVLPLYIMLEELGARFKPIYFFTIVVFGAASLYCCYIFSTGWWLL